MYPALRALLVKQALLADYNEKQERPGTQMRPMKLRWSRVKPLRSPDHARHFSMIRGFQPGFLYLR
jgi:hypothetical protein